MIDNRRKSEGAHIIGSPEAKTRGPGPEVMAANTLEGNEVFNSQGEKLGTIEAIMLDVRQGRIAYAVLSRGGVLRIGDRLYAIPWPALTLDTDRKCFVLDISAERLDQDKGFDKDHWPAMADEAWARETYAYYEQPPYW